MKKLISFALGLCICCGVFAQQEKIDELLRHISQGDRICLDFSFCQNGNSKLKTNGCLELQGNFYCVTMSGVKIICDGTTQWTIDSIGQEVYIEPGGLLLGYLSNPNHIKSSLSSLNLNGNSISGVLMTGKTGGIKIQFTLKNIVCSEPLKDLSGFCFNSSDYTLPWVITDLR